MGRLSFSRLVKSRVITGGNFQMGRIAGVIDDHGAVVTGINPPVPETRRHLPADLPELLPSQ